MDDRRFDALARSLAAQPSRRGLLRLLAGTALGIGLGRRSAEAQTCSLVGGSCASRPCCAGARCTQANRCVCQAGFTACTIAGGGQQCFDLDSDERHCGRCANRCTTTVANASAVCRNGFCGFACNAGFRRCGDACVRLTTDDNCGACGNVCEAGSRYCARCRDSESAPCAGEAEARCCLNGRVNCGGACVDLRTDANNCGGCGLECPVGRACVNRLCAADPCTADNDFCGNGDFFDCGTDPDFPAQACHCQRAKQDGAIVCGTNGRICTDCATHADCVPLYGPTARCVVAGGICCDDQPSPTSCVKTCGPNP